MVKALLEKATPATIADVFERIDTLSQVFAAPNQFAALNQLPEWKGETTAWLTRPLATSWTVDVHKCVMHPSSSYEEFIGGLRPIPGGHFQWVPGQFVRFLERAQEAHKQGKDSRFLIVLDEINRCNLASVLGELMYIIDPSRRVADSVMDEHHLEKECRAVDVHPEPQHHQRLWIPTNFFILGTMNSSDRSILGFDQALRRRFPPFRLEPFVVEHFKEFCSAKGGSLPDYTSTMSQPTTAGGIFCVAVNQYAALNCLLRFLIGPDAMIGHSFLLQALTNAGFGDKRTTSGFDGVSPTILQQEIDAAWQFGILPQVIHAAEATRNERVAEALTASSKERRAVEQKWLCETYLPHADEEAFGGTVKRLKEAIKAVGLTTLIDYDARYKKKADDAAALSPPTKPDYREVLLEAYETIYQLAVEPTSQDIQLDRVGHGHGARLLITNTRPKP